MLSLTPRRAASILLKLVAVSSIAAAAARANGAFPDEFSIHFPPDAQHRILLGANFGLLVSEDDGATWRYSCEPWVVAGSNAALASANVGFYQVTAAGAILANSVNLTRSSDVGCTWPISTGSVGGQIVTDFFPDPNDATFVLAIVTLSSGTGSYIVASHDGGITFDAPHLYDTPDLLTGIEIALSKRGVVYATSVSTSGAATFLASTNSGAAGSWTPTPLEVSRQTQPRILAIDPADEKTVYLRLLSGPSDSISVTTNGGQSFTQSPILTINGQFSAFLRAGDGALYAGTRDGKLYVQAAGTSGFATRDGPHFRCLGQRRGATRIYACADMIVDGYSLATSDDNGITFHPMMSFTQLLGPLTCAPVQTNCEAHWERIQGVLGIGSGADAGQNPGGGSGSGGGSHCASAGADLPALLAFAVILWRRAERRTKVSSR
ncbi:MAG: hypothetical protein E6J67_08435 [Deltaproteobacteria bacterium]|nr:MAG: hypothetical protein E6J67_08435 [Deltaproteobacteria bacterium]